jgi:RNA polymerase sigma-70 factor (sigma-E family)
MLLSVGCNAVSVSTRHIGVGIPVRDREVTLAEFADTHWTALVRFAYLLTADRHRAEDLVQDVMLAMHRKFGDALAVDDPLAYARRAVVNGLTSWLRVARNRELTSFGLHAPDAVGPDPQSESQHQLWRQLGSLTFAQRAVLVLRYYEDLPDDEIARVLDCRPATVRSHAARALRALRLTLDNDSERSTD